MEQLLTDWNVPPDVKENFVNNGIDIDQLKDITDNLLKELCPLIGARIKLKHKIEEYLTAESTTVSMNASLPCSLNDITDCEDADNINIADVELALAHYRPHFPDFELKTLLSTSPCGTSILNYYETHKNLSDKHRNNLTDIIIRHIFTRIVNYRLNYEEYNILTSKIISLFPKENAGTYFVPPIKKSLNASGKPSYAKGKLVDKVRNILFKSGERKRQRTLSDDNENTNPNKTNRMNIEELKDSKADDIVWLKNNSEPWGQFIEKWSNTHDVRESSTYETLKAFIEEWPILQDPRGEVLINLDFDKQYENRNTKFFQNWRNFLEKIKNMKSPYLKDNTSKLVEFIDNVPDDDAKLPSEIKLLCHLVPPKGRKSKREKFSTFECVQCFIVDVENPGDIETKVEEVSTRAFKNKQCVQPYIIHCSTDETGGTYYLVIDKVRYRFKSSYKAFDTLFKCYHSFHASYPAAAEHLFVLIQRCVYNIVTKYDKIVPYIADLVTNAKV